MEDISYRAKILTLGIGGTLVFSLLLVGGIIALSDDLMSLIVYSSIISLILLVNIIFTIHQLRKYHLNSVIIE